MQQRSEKRQAMKPARKKMAEVTTNPIAGASGSPDRGVGRRVGGGGGGDAVGDRRRERRKRWCGGKVEEIDEEKEEKEEIGRAHV